MEASAPAPRLASVQEMFCPVLQAKLLELTFETSSRPSTLSVRLTLSACDGPLLWTVTVKVPGLPPAITAVGENDFETARSTLRTTFTVALVELLAPSFDVTDASFWTGCGSAVEATW